MKPIIFALWGAFAALVILWLAAEPRLTLIAKALGDLTSRLREAIKSGQEVKVEGPYGGFAFADECRYQIWVRGGIGITPFVGRIKQLARRRAARDPPPAQIVDLFHTTADRSDEVPEWREASIWFCGPAGWRSAAAGFQGARPAHIAALSSKIVRHAIHLAAGASLHAVKQIAR